MIHFFWECTRAKKLWSSTKLVFPNVMDQLCFFKKMLWCLMMDKKSSLENIELLLTCVWAMWSNRNEVRHGGTRKDGRTLFQWAMQYLDEYRVAVDLLLVPQMSVQHVQTWIPPTTLCLKFNVNAVVFAELHSVGVGIIAQDWNGRFVVAMCKKIQASLGPLEAESKAVEVGLQFASWVFQT